MGRRADDMTDSCEWKIDHAVQTVTHATGLVVQIAPDALFADKWTGRCLNARPWAEADFARRAPMLGSMLRAALKVYAREHSRACGKKPPNL